MSSIKKAFPVIVLPHLFSEDRQKQDLIFVYLFFDLLEQHVNSAIYFINPNSFNPFSGDICSIDQALLESSNLGLFRKNYLHLSSNGYLFERYCIERFFYVRELMEKQGIKKAFLIETDVFLFSDPHVLFSSCGFNIDDNYLIQNRCIGTSFVDIRYLDAFCTNIINSYTTGRGRVLLQEWHRQYLSSGHKGGVCDMTFCYWMNAEEMELDPFESRDISEPFTSEAPTKHLQAFDNSIQTLALGSIGIQGTRSPVNDWPMKQIYFYEGTPFVLANGEVPIQLLSIHCQGRAKNLMGSLYSMASRRKTGKFY